jgi:FtsZ-binding cell division protein ZapB
VTEQIRLALDIIRSALAPLTEADRTVVLVELAIVEATELNAVRKQLDEAREQTEAFRRHNEQRLEEVYAARKLLGAMAHETLPAAILRWRCGSPIPKYEPPCVFCTPEEPCGLHGGALAVGGAVAK